MRRGKKNKQADVKDKDKTKLVKEKRTSEEDEWLAEMAMVRGYEKGVGSGRGVREGNWI